MVVVLAAQVVDIAGADERPPDLAGDPHDPLVRPVLLGEPVLLHLEVDVVGTERAEQLVGVRARLVRPLLEQVLAEARLQAAGERDHALGVRRHLLEVDRRLAALIALEEAGRGQLDEVPVAGRRRGQQRQVEAVEPAGRTPRVIGDDVHLAPEDRLDAVLAAGRRTARPRRS